MNSTKTYAKTAGWSLIVMAILAGFAYGYVHNTLVDPNEARQTADNIQQSLPLFKAGILAWILIWVSDLLVTWAFYHFFKPVHPSRSLLTAALRLVYTLVLGGAIYYLVRVAANPTASDLMESLAAFESVWSLGLIVFGGHLLGLGLLAQKDKRVPGIWTWLLLIAGPSYSFLALSDLMDWIPAAQLATIEMILTLPMTLSELGLAIWMLVRGVRV